MYTRATEAKEKLTAKTGVQLWSTIVSKRSTRSSKRSESYENNNFSNNITDAQFGLQSPTSSIISSTSTLPETPKPTQSANRFHQLVIDDGDEDNDSDAETVISQSNQIATHRDADKGRIRAEGLIPCMLIRDIPDLLLTAFTSSVHFRAENNGKDVPKY